MFGTLQASFARWADAQLSRLSPRALEKSVRSGFGADTPALTGLADVARNYRLGGSPALVRELGQLDAFWGRDVTRRLASQHGGDRSAFLVDLVANAERRGYGNLAGLQRSIPDAWLVQQDCTFCHTAERFKPDGILVDDSAHFQSGPNMVQMFTNEESGGHMMVFGKQHRSTPSATPEALRQEFVGMIRRTKAEMEATWGKPVSLFANGSPAADPRVQHHVDSHAHVQLFSGDATLTDAVLKETGLGRDRVIPINGFEDYFKLYDAGKLRDKYLLTLDAREKGAVILLGDAPTQPGLAMRNARVSLGLPEVPGGKKALINPERAALVAGALKAHYGQTPDPASVRAILAQAPVR